MQKLRQAVIAGDIASLNNDLRPNACTSDAAEATWAARRPVGITFAPLAPTPGKGEPDATGPADTTAVLFVDQVRDRP